VIKMTNVTEPILEIKGLSRIYGMGEVKVKALNKISFEISRGDFVAIMGKSGSGKSTLLHQLGLLDMPNSGEMALGRKKEEYMKAGTIALEQVGLGTRLHHCPREMAGGEQQRVAIARALINKPDILFADEPTANLDSISSKQVIELFQKLNRETGLTILMVTHEPDDVKYVSTVVWLKDGELAEQGA
jgi:putative ABC transport system ATP-binding protein